MLQGLTSSKHWHCLATLCTKLIVSNPQLHPYCPRAAWWHLWGCCCDRFSLWLLLCSRHATAILLHKPKPGAQVRGRRTVMLGEKRAAG